MLPQARIILVILLFLPNWLTPWGAVGKDFEKPVQVSHHRGALKYAPENTLPAFEKSIELGADFVEFDIRPSKDGVYFLLHDRNLDRTTDGEGPINEMTAEEIDKLDAGSSFSDRFAGEKIPTLDQFLEEISGRVGLYVDAKEISPEDLIEKLRKYHAVDSSVVYGGVHYLAQLKDLEPSIKTLAPLSDIEEIDSIVKEFKPYAFDCSWDALSKELINHAHQLGIKVFSDAMGEHENRKDYLQAIGWGIDLIQTNHPDRVKAAIEEYIEMNIRPQLLDGGRIRQTEPPSGKVILEAGVVKVGSQRIPFDTQVFEIPPEPPLLVDRQLYRVHALTDRKSPGHWDGEGPRGPGTHRSYQRLVPGSLVVSSTDGSTVYRPDVDYIYDYYWGSIKPATGGAIQPNTDVAIAYKCYRCRYDTIAIDPNGKASIVRGESMPPDPTELLLPYPPTIPESSLRLGNIFTGWTNNKITEGSIGDFVPDSQNESSSEATPLEAGGRYDDILPRDYLVEIEEPGPVGVATYRVAATGDPYGVDPPRSLDDPVFRSSIRTSTQEATPLSFPVNDGRTADYSLRIDFRPMGGTVLAKGDRWTLRAEPRMIFNRDASPPELFPNNEIEGQRKKIQKNLERLEQGEKVRVVFLGESTTSGGYWPTLFAKGLQDLYPRATVEAFNVGIGGENILGGLPRLEQDVFSKDPDLVIVEYLINDSGVNFRHDDSEGPGPVETSHRELLQKIQDHGGIEVVYLTANMGNPAFVQAYTFENFRRTSDLYHSLCEEFGCAYVDSFRVWENMGEAMGQYFITRLKGNMVNHPFGNQDIAWSADETNAEWLLKLFQPKE